MLVLGHFTIHVIEEIGVRIWQRNLAWDWLNIYYDPLKPILKERLYIFPITELGFQHVKRNIRLFAHIVACLLPDNPKKHAQQLSNNWGRLTRFLYPQKLRHSLSADRVQGLPNLPSMYIFLFRLNLFHGGWRTRYLRDSGFRNGRL